MSLENEEFSTLNFVFAGILAFICFLVFLAQSVIVWATVREGNWKSLSVSQKLILAFCLAELLFVVNAGGTFVWEIIHGKGPRGGTIECALNGLLIIGLEFFSLAMVIGINVDRYLIIIKRQYISNRTANIYIATFFILACFLFLILPFASGYWTFYMVPESSKLVCSLPFWITTKPGILITSILALIFVASSFSIMVYCYWKIFTFYLSVKRPSSSKILTIDAFSPQEMKLLIKVVAISLAFFLSWFPYLFKIIYEMSFQKPAHPIWDSICCIFVSLNFLLNSIFLYLFDGFIKRNVNDLLDCWGIRSLQFNFLCGKWNTKDARLRRSRSFDVSSLDSHVGSSTTSGEFIQGSGDFFIECGETIG